MSGACNTLGSNKKHIQVLENCTPLGYYAASSGNFLFLVRNYRYSQSNNPEERSSRRKSAVTHIFKHYSVKVQGRGHLGDPGVTRSII
jgi:hypothetical protein